MFLTSILQVSDKSLKIIMDKEFAELGINKKETKKTIVKKETKKN